MVRETSKELPPSLTFGTTTVPPVDVSSSAATLFGIIKPDAVVTLATAKRSKTSRRLQSSDGDAFKLSDLTGEGDEGNARADANSADSTTNRRSAVIVDLADTVFWIGIIHEENRTKVMWCDVA